MMTTEPPVPDTAGVTRRSTRAFLVRHGLRWLPIGFVIPILAAFAAASAAFVGVHALGALRSAPRPRCSTTGCPPIAARRWCRCSR
jgi:hypothetical protein